MQKKIKNPFVTGVLALAACTVAGVAGYSLTPAPHTILPSRVVETAEEETVEAPAVELTHETIISSPDADEADMTVYVEILDEDRIPLEERYALPPLERIGEEDAADTTDPAQALARVQALGINPAEFGTPEKNWKKIYNAVRTALEPVLAQAETAAFSGGSVSELNAFLREHTGETVRVIGAELAMDETLSVPDGAVLLGGGVRLIPGEQRLDKAVELDNVTDCAVKGLVISGGCDYGIYVKNSSNFCLADNEISGVTYKGIVVMGTNEGLYLYNNYIHENHNGGIFLNGDISRGILESNRVINNEGSDNLMAGIVLCSVEIVDIDTAYNLCQDTLLCDIIRSPNHLVLLGNTVQENKSSGIYSHSGYCNYYIENDIFNNEKEGMCLDCGSFGNYVAWNVIRQNGGRNRMSDEDLEADFVLGLGRLEDGSSPAKLPGISLDNAAYNILYQNIISQNYGSGLKAVRSAYRNTVLCNEITDNNLGQSDLFHFFGVELSTDTNADEPVQGLDFTPCYENIIARNTISGPHYAGIFLGEGAFTNDIFDNTILGCTWWSMESLSGRWNSTLNNYSNVQSRGITLNDGSETISIADWTK